MKWCAPSSQANFSFSGLLDRAATLYPSLLANCTARCPRPPRPCIATRSPAVISIFRIPLNVATPAQRRGAISAGSMSLGSRATASTRRTQYSASGIFSSQNSLHHSHSKPYGISINRDELTSSRSCHAIDLFIIAQLKITPIAFPANT
ncbi:hypothetical protein I7I53_01604 [Histoplasma capsulatum var. duboisii H88]|uniref:Uncharacterized protein n=1 Tax=Ajellomyces capsulatus (strain H88) TaxID=544711 RepID=A0A8A1LQ93_AJEC8|nr:hypothetical protein I7I53_01604 [Histoplasma capsulatum var. duboisii H88]